MTSPPDDRTTDTSAIIAALRTERDAALAREAALAEELAARTAEMTARTAESADRKTEFDERIEHQAATVDVLRVMSASPSDTLPVFNLITRRAAELCESSAALYELREGQLNYMAGHGMDLEALAAFRLSFPQPLDRSLVVGRAILERRIVHVQNVAADTALLQVVRDLGGTAIVAIPLLRDGEPVGAIALNGRQPGGFSESQIALLQTFAEQAVIAITSAETYRGLHEALEQQTATAEVLQVINASPGDLAPVFDAMLEKAMRLCDGAQGTLWMFDGERMCASATAGYSSELAKQLSEWREIHPFQRRLSQGERVFQIVDLAAEELYHSGNPLTRAAVDVAGIRTVAFVALVKDATTLGGFTIGRREVRAFTDKHIALLQNFAEQAVIAIENTRLITEQREALEQQIATAEVLQVINSSPGNLTPVFDAMLDNALRLCGAAFGSLYTSDGEHIQPVALRGVPPAFADFITKDPWTPPPGSSPARVLATKRPVQVPDVMDGEMYRIGAAHTHALVEIGGVRALVSVPLLRDDTVLGFFTIYRRDPGPFSDKQIALLENFAAQAVIAMENARLIAEQHEALEQQTATAEVLQVINASPGNLVPVFDAVLERALRLCGAAFGMLGTYDGTRFRWEARLGGADRRRGVVVTPEPGSALERVANGQRVVHIPDLVDTDAYRNGIPSRVGLVERSGARAGLWVALRKDDTVLGVILIYRREPRAFSEKQIALLESFAAQAVIAMENARLINETHEALEQQTATAEVLGVINSSPGDLGPVFDAILEKAHALCGAATGSLQLYDGEFFRAVATRGLPDEFANILRQPHRSGLREALLRDAPFVQITDIADPVLTGGDKTLAAAPDIAGVRTYLRVPLRKDDVLLGSIIAGRREVRPFSQKEISLLQSFAAQAVIAMENARLLDEIRQRQAELRTTFDNMGDGVAMFDADLRLAAWNRNFQQIIDLPDALLRERPRYADYMRLLTERGEFGTTDIEEELRHRIEDTDQELRLERVRPDGRVIEVRRNAVPGGGFVLIYSDITERKRSEEEIRAARDAAETALRELRTAQANLIQAEKMASLGQLTAGIAHEIKNPLNFVNNFSALSTELIDELRDVLAPEPLGETARTEVDDLTALLKGNLEKVVQHGQRADGIVRSMLDHSRGSSGERRMVDLNALIDEALNLAYHGARAQDQSFNITLERDFGEGISPIEVNPQDITRVFLNLFANGFYAVTRRAREGGDAAFVPTLKVTTIDAGEAVEIRVRDNGTGIPADIRDKLFQPFFTTKPTGEGTGLGLSITYDIVTQQHGGSIAVDSKVGEYSEFTIQLPRNP